MAQRMTIAAARESPTQGCFIFNQLSDSPATTTAYASPEEALKKLSDIHLSSNGDKATQKPGKKSIWVNLQGAAEEQNRQAVQYLFPNMQQSQLDALLSPDAMYDMVELQPVRGEYLVGAIACSPSNLQMHSVTPNHAVAQGSDEDDVVLCLFVCSEQCLLTMHATPFMGLAETLHHAHTGLGVRCTPGALSASHDMASSVTSRIPLMTGATILCVLVCFTCEARLPNLTPLISEVDCIDEMVMLVAPGKHDQVDLFRRVAGLRRRIAAANNHMYMKEKLLNELMKPIMRTTFVSQNPLTLNAYKEVLEELLDVVERLESSRDALIHANLNFVTAVSMRMSQASARLDKLAILLTQMATACLPANLLASVFSMNCKVMWVADEYDTLLPFFCVMLIIAVWMVFALYAPVRNILSKTPK